MHQHNGGVSTPSHRCELHRDSQHRGSSTSGLGSGDNRGLPRCALPRFALEHNKNLTSYTNFAKYHTTSYVFKGRALLAVVQDKENADTWPIISTAVRGWHRVSCELSCKNFAVIIVCIYFALPYSIEPAFHPSPPQNLLLIDIC